MTKIVKSSMIIMMVISMVNLVNADITIDFPNTGGVNNTDVDSAGAANETPFTDDDGFVIGAYFAGAGVGGNNDITMSNSTTIIKIRDNPSAGTYIYSIFPLNGTLGGIDQVDPTGLTTVFAQVNAPGDNYQYLLTRMPPHLTGL